MKVVVYHNTVPNNKNIEKIQVLKNFSKGISKCGDTVLDDFTNEYKMSDVGVLQGWVTQDVKNSPHLILRNQIINDQLKMKKNVVAIDSNLFLFANPTNTPNHYLRYSFNGIFPNTGIYCDDNPDPSRWNKIKKNCNLEIKDYRKNGNHILMCLQRNGGWSMAGLDVQDWALQTIQKIRQFSDRPIIIRSHPGDKKSKNYLNPKNKDFKLKNLNNIFFSVEGSTLQEDLKNCWCVINHNSSPSVGSALEGYPIFVTDPAKSQCSEIANLDLSLIENPKMPDRTKWVERISMFHWSFEELRSGECWAHMRKYI